MTYHKRFAGFGLGILALFAAVMIVAVGCGGGGEKLYAVSGTVKLNGQNLDKGTIRFDPDGAYGSQGGAEIVNGAYSIDAENGLKEGKYKVSISSPEGGAAAGPVELPGESNVPAAKERISEEFNAKTTLKAEIPSGNNKFDFDVK